MKLNHQELLILKNFLRKENPIVFLKFLDWEKEINNVIESSKKIQSKITDFV